LDVDITHPGNNSLAVENTTWSSRERMIDGQYEFAVHNYADRSGKDGFNAEIEVDGQVFKFEHVKRLLRNQRVVVAVVTLSKGTFSIDPKLTHTEDARNVWGLKSNEFHPVKMVTYSPNMWSGKKIGNLHYMFIVDQCINPDQPSGFFNEYVIDELREHRHVIEALVNEMRVAPSENQLSGFGFSSTIPANVTLRIVDDNSKKRIVNVVF